MFKRRSFVPSRGLRAMPGSGSHEPNIVKPSRKVPQHPGETARFEPVPFDRERHAHSASTRVRTFPQRTTAVSTSTHKDTTPAPRANDAYTGASSPAVATAADKREAAASALPLAEPHTRTFTAKSDNLPLSALQAVVRAGRLTWDATLLLVFSPVIAVWWLLERRHRKGGR